jgi:hypothetical protein
MHVNLCMFNTQGNVLDFVGVKREAYHRGKHLKGAPLAYSVDLAVNIRLGWKGLLGINTNQLRRLVNYDCKKFYSICPRAYKF